MSRRDRTEKKLKRLRKTLKTQPLEAQINLLEWLQDRRYAQSTGQARKIILDGRVRSESHVLGIRSVEHPLTHEKMEVVHPWVPARLRTTLHVVSPNQS